ncbi:epidermal growth factor receptor kinase substrate 8-like protein 3 [Tiliqua scincoides]|uniref:epidermal growth factor receptor kinase substrate 8-like protein 3 n=1 Tax=Tiliqua scincoides TaxID=71010 RepID=UPI003461C542
MKRLDVLSCEEEEEEEDDDNDDGIQLQIKGMLKKSLRQRQGGKEAGGATSLALSVWTGLGPKGHLKEKSIKQSAGFELWKMADIFGSRDNVYNEIENGLRRTNSMSRPSSKTIYRQRKEYVESVLKQINEFQHRVEHLFTGIVDSKEICNVEDCVNRLKMMDAQGQVWGQDMILQVTNHKLQLVDTEAEEELDCYPLESIQDCASIVDSCIYNSILAITVKEMNPHKTSIMLFQCEQIGADLMKTKVEKAIAEWRDERQNQDLLRTNLENMLHQRNQASFTVIVTRYCFQALTHCQHMDLGIQANWGKKFKFLCASSMTDLDALIIAEIEQPLRQEQNGEPAWEDRMMWEINRNTEILNHVLDDIELFVGKLPQDDKKKKKSKKKIQKALPSQPEFMDYYQKVKYGFNLLGKLEFAMQQPSASDVVHLLFSTLSTVLANCPWANLAPTVISPLLIPPAIDLLRRTLDPNEHLIWKNLGQAWNVPRAEYPDGQSVPVYIPTFSDGWVVPMPIKRQITDADKVHNGTHNSLADRRSDPPQLMQAMYEFHARNSRELTVRKGDLLEVLDQRKKWWLARNAAGEEGYIPNNILEPMDQMAPKRKSMERVSRDVLDLHPDSTAAEVTVWLRTKGFSKITVKALGVLNGSQLLSLSPAELKTVCPEEGRRVFSMLSEVRSRLQNDSRQ